MGVRFTGSSNVFFDGRVAVLGTPLETLPLPDEPPLDFFRFFGSAFRRRSAKVGSCTMGPVSAGISIGSMRVRLRAFVAAPPATAVPRAATSKRFQCFPMNRVIAFMSTGDRISSVNASWRQ